MSERLHRLREMRAWIDTEIAQEEERLGLLDTSVDLAIGRACALYGVEPGDVLGTSRKQQTVRARQAAAWLLRRAGLSYPRIGAVLNVDHTTALHSCRKIDRSPSVKALLLGIEAVA